MTTKTCQNCGRSYNFVNGKYNAVGDYYTTYCPPCGAPVDYIGPLRGYNNVIPQPITAMSSNEPPFDVEAWQAAKVTKEEEDAGRLDAQIAEMENLKNK